MIILLFIMSLLKKSRCSFLLELQHFPHLIFLFSKLKVIILSVSVNILILGEDLRYMSRAFAF